MPGIDCNFPLCSARNQEELDMRCRGAAGAFVKDRHLVLARFLQEAERNSATEKTRNENAVRIHWSTIDLLREKLDANAVLYQIFEGTADVDIRTGFFEASRKAWEETLPLVFEQLERMVQGPFALADEIVRLQENSSFRDT